MPIKMMRFSSSIAAGLGSLDSIGEYLTGLYHDRNILMLSGEKAYNLAGKTIEGSLGSHGISCESIVRNFSATYETADQLSGMVKDAKEKTPDLTVMAVGGGTVIDLAKYVTSREQTKLVAIPTLLSSDAMASSYSVLRDGTKNAAVRTKAPDLIIGDYEVLKNQPKRFVSAGVGDMLSKVSGLYDWRLGFWLGNEPYSDFAMNVARSTTDLLEKRILDVARMNYIGIETLFLAEVTDGYLMELSGTTRVAAGSEHLFAFAMENMGGNGLHGEYCALGTIMMTYLQSRHEHDVKGFLQAAGVPTTAEELGASRKEIVRALTTAHSMRPWYTILGANGLSEGAAERLARYTGII